MSHQGRCNCGKFVFTAPEPQGIAICFCRCCTRSGGSLCSHNAVIVTDQLKFSKGSLDELKKYDDKEVASGNKLLRAFCPECGSAVISLPADGPISYLKVSTMEDQEAYTKGKLNAVVFTKNALPWTKDSLLAHLPETVVQTTD